MVSWKVSIKHSEGKLQDCLPTVATNSSPNQAVPFEKPQIASLGQGVCSYATRVQRLCRKILRGKRCSVWTPVGRYLSHLLLLFYIMW